MVLKLTKKPENRRTGMAVTGPTKVATWGEGPSCYRVTTISSTP